jgi:hypothetical protein
VLVVTDKKGEIFEMTFRLDPRSGDLQVDSVGMAESEKLEGFSYYLAVFPRAGIKSYEGKAIEKKQP